MGAPSFKMMGATPGESPAQLRGLISWAWKALTKGPKVKKAVTATNKKKDGLFNKKTGKLKAKHNKTDVDNVIKESADNAVAKKSLEYGGITQATKDAFDVALGVGAWTYVDGKLSTKEDGVTTEVGPIESEVVWDDVDSTGSDPEFKGTVPGNVKNKD